MTDQHSASPLAQPPAFGRRTLLRGGFALGLGAASSVARPSVAHARSLGRHIPLSMRGTTHYRIYLGASEGVVVQQAAAELSQYLEQITGASFEIVASDTPPDDGQLIVVGRDNPLAARIGASIDYGTLGDDGFAYRTQGLTVLVAGPSPRGTLYGAYWLLDHIAGVRWYAPDCTYVPDNPDLQIPLDQLNSDHVPRFRYRLILAADANNPAYRQHNMLNGRRDRYWPPTTVTPAAIDTWSSYWPEERANTYDSLLPAQYRYGGQLRCMDEDVREAATTALIANIHDRIAAGEDVSASFIQNDKLWTPDAASQAFIDNHGGAQSAALIDMTNDVCGRVRQTYPTARLSMQAYQTSWDVPTAITVDDNVVLTVAATKSNRFQSLGNAVNTPIWTVTSAWAGLANNIVYWDYLVTYSCYIMPFPTWLANARGIKDLAGLPGSVQGYMGQAANDTAGAELAYLKLWVYSRLLWDPSLDIDELVEEFTDGYYGPAGPQVRNYMNIFINACATTGGALTSTTGLMAPYLNYDSLKDADAELAAAEKLAWAAGGDFQTRVRILRMATDFVILLRRAELNDAAAQRGDTWQAEAADPADPAYPAYPRPSRDARFKWALSSSGLTRARLGGWTPTEVRTLVTLERVLAPRPEIVPATVGDDDWKDLQDLEYRLSSRAPATLVQDTQASDHVAVQMPGPTAVWGVQLPLLALPLDGAWKIHVRMRVDAPTTTPDTATGAVFGVYSPALGVDTVGQPVTVGDLRNGYAWFEVPPLSATHDGAYSYEDQTYVWVRPPNTTDIVSLYIDRMVAIRAS